MRISACTSDDIEDWAQMRSALWPGDDVTRHRNECLAMVSRAGERVAFLAHDEALAIGFAEASLRHDYVNGCESNPVAFLEGIFVRGEWRRRGVARALVEAVRAWASGQECLELASDALLDNEAGQAMHRALGFEETERVVYFKQILAKPSGT